jgi:hypothetical protein
MILGFSRGTRSPGAAALCSTVEAAFFFAGGGRLVAGWRITRSLYPGDEDLVDDELAAKGPPVNAAP